MDTNFRIEFSQTLGRDIQAAAKLLCAKVDAVYPQPPLPEAWKHYLSWFRSLFVDIPYRQEIRLRQILESDHEQMAAELLLQIPTPETVSALHHEARKKFFRLLTHKSAEILYRHRLQDVEHLHPTPRACLASVFPVSIQTERAESFPPSETELDGAIQEMRTVIYNMEAEDPFIYIRFGF